MKKKRTPKIILDEIKSLLDELSFLIGAQNIASDSQEQRHQVAQVMTKDSYSGPIGGIRFLVGEGFFKEPKALAEVINRLHQEGFNYRKQVIATTLLRLVRDRKLTRLPISKTSSRRGKWNYVERR